MDSLYRCCVHETNHGCAKYLSPEIRGPMHAEALLRLATIVELHVRKPRRLCAGEYPGSAAGACLISSRATGGLPCSEITGSQFHPNEHGGVDQIHQNRSRYQHQQQHAGGCPAAQRTTTHATNNSTHGNGLRSPDWRCIPGLIPMRDI